VRRSPERPTDDLSPAWLPARVLQIDLDEPIPSLPPPDCRAGAVGRRDWVLVRLHTRPLGTVEVEVPDAGLEPSELARRVWARLGPAILAHLREDGLDPVGRLEAAGLPCSGRPRCLRVHDELLAAAPLVSVVVATRDRPHLLAPCLGSLQGLAYPRYEIIVVDNAPRGDETRALVGRIAGPAPVRYLREDEPGLSAARNRGLRAARGELVAFTDDDVLVDRHWLSHLAAGFRCAERVACVTGNILPAEIETPAQLWVEQFGGLGKGYQRRIYDLREHRAPGPLFPYAAGVFGSGANLAFETRRLRAMGGFDPALSTGTVARGGEDLAAFFAVLTSGFRLVYEPSAIVCHRHHRGEAELRRQLHGYGVGLTAYLTKVVLDDPRRALDLLGRIPDATAFLARRQARRGASAGFARALAKAELVGMAYGPLAYVRSRLCSRRRSARPRDGR